MDKPAFEVIVTDWATHQAELAAIRRTVFIDEQHVPEALEMDGEDARCVHALARAAGGEAIGTGRLLPSGQIGRMAVVRAWRGRGVGLRLLQTLVAEARRRRLPCHLNAQTHALDFYAQAGFRAQGEEFMEAGIAHRRMVLATAPPRTR